MFNPGGGGGVESPTVPLACIPEAERRGQRVDNSGKNI